MSVLSLGDKARHLSVGRDHSCAILDDDSLYCWGANNDDHGQVGRVHEHHVILKGSLKDWFYPTLV